MKLAILLLALFASPTYAAGRVNHLMFLGGTVHLVATWTNGPNGSPAESLLRAEWVDGATHTLIEAPGSFDVRIFMPAMGHGSSPTQLNRVLDGQGRPIPGAYQVAGIYFTMPGDWEVRVTLRTPDGKSETESFPVHL